MELFEHGLDAESLRFLRAVGVRHVTQPRAASDPAPPGVRLVASFAQERVLELDDGPRAAVVRPGDAVATRWSPTEVLLTLAEPRRVGRVAFELSDAEWLARPSVFASLDGVTWEALPAEASLADATLSLYREPQHARGEVRFAARTARLLRLDARLPARAGALEVGE
jgi:hypothetical protein